MRRRRARFIENQKEKFAGAPLEPLSASTPRRSSSPIAVTPAGAAQDLAPRGIAAHLDVLETSGLIHLAQALPDLQYLFRHALLQDAAYHSLMKGDRRAQHRSVGDALERLYADRLDELAPVLAMHFDEAGDDERALQYYRRAGDFAVGRYANAEAVVHFTRALGVTRRIPAAQALPLLQLFTRRGRALELSGQFEQAVANYREMEIQGCDRGDRVLELAALMARATIHSTPSSVHDPLQGKALSVQALVLARELEDRQAESKILWNLMLLCQFTGHMHDAVAYGEQSLTIAREIDLREQLAYTLNDSVRAGDRQGRDCQTWCMQRHETVADRFATGVEEVGAWAAAAAVVVTETQPCDYQDRSRVVIVDRQRDLRDLLAVDRFRQGDVIGQQTGEVGGAHVGRRSERVVEPGVRDQVVVLDSGGLRLEQPLQSAADRRRAAALVGARWHSNVVYRDVPNANRGRRDFQWCTRCDRRRPNQRRRERRGTYICGRCERMSI